MTPNFPMKKTWDPDGFTSELLQILKGEKVSNFMRPGYSTYKTIQRYYKTGRKLQTKISHEQSEKNLTEY